MQYAYCMKHTVVSWPFSLGHTYIQQRRLWFLCTLQFLLHRRHHCKHRLAFARTLTLLLLGKRYLLHKENILVKKDCSMQIHQNTRKKQPNLSMHPFHNEREQLLRQAMQLIHSQRGMLPKLHMRLTYS